MTVYDLNQDQLAQLKHNLFYTLLYENPDLLDDEGIEFYWDIPDRMIEEAYDGISFTEDDFA